MLVVQSEPSECIYTQITKPHFLFTSCGLFQWNYHTLGFIYLGFEIYISRDFCLQPNAIEVNVFFYSFGAHSSDDK